MLSKEFIEYGQEFCAAIILMIGIVLFIRDRVNNKFIALYYLCTALAVTRSFDFAGGPLFLNLRVSDVHVLAVQLSLLLLFLYSWRYYAPQHQFRFVQHMILQLPLYILLICVVAVDTNLYESGEVTGKQNWFFALRLVLFISCSLTYLYLFGRNRRQQKELLKNANRFNWFIRLQFLVPLVIQIPLVLFSMQFPELTAFYDYSNLFIWCIYILTPALIPEIFFQLKSDAMKKDKYFSSSLKGEDEKEIFERVKTHLEIKEPFLDKSFSLQTLSRDMNINAAHISQAVNKQRNLSFSEFVNYYRVLKARDLIQSNAASNYTIESIGEFAGFKSKATFYRAFKKQTGMTPSEMLSN